VVLKTGHAPFEVLNLLVCIERFCDARQRVRDGVLDRVKTSIEASLY
jgi:hypothetical protein